MRIILIPAAAALTLPLAPMAFAGSTGLATGARVSGTVQSVDMQKQTMTMADGHTLSMAYPATLKKLKPGEHISFKVQDNAETKAADIQGAQS